MTALRKTTIGTIKAKNALQKLVYFNNLQKP